MGFAFGFDLFGVIFTLMFLMIFGVFVVTIGKSILQWNKNNHSPRLTVPATVIAKRAHHSRHHNSNTHHSSTSTNYYVTFEVESGDRMELNMTGPEYGLLVEGDRGQLTFQGTRYLSFERTRGY